MWLDEKRNKGKSKTGQMLMANPNPFHTLVVGRGAQFHDNFFSNEYTIVEIRVSSRIIE